MSPSGHSKHAALEEPTQRHPPSSTRLDRFFNIEDTAGCSCEQIIEELMLGSGHTKFGCSTSAMEEWIGGVRE